MTNSRRYFNQKFIALLIIVLGALGLTFSNLMTEQNFMITSLISYAIFAGLDTFSFDGNGISMNRDKD